MSKNENRQINKTYTKILKIKTTKQTFSKALRELLDKYKITEEPSHNRSNFNKDMQEIKVFASENRKNKTTGSNRHNKENKNC